MNMKLEDKPRNKSNYSDELYESAKKFILEQNQASQQTIKDEFKCTQRVAVRIMDKLEFQKVIKKRGKTRFFDVMYDI